MGTGLKNKMIEHRFGNKRLEDIVVAEIQHETWTNIALDYFGRRLSPTSCGESTFSFGRF